MSTVIAFIIIFGALVFFHELGHLIFAKRAGILCREFAIGMGPKILSFKKNETVYTIRLLPIGGYVRMAGEDAEFFKLKSGQRAGLVFNDQEEVVKIHTSNKGLDNDARVIEVDYSDLEHQMIIRGFIYGDEDEALHTFKVSEEALIVDGKEEELVAPYHKQFPAKSVGARAMTIFAGPFFNFILAAIIFIILGLFQGIPSNNPIVGEVTSDGAAYSAGLKQGDVIHSIDGAEVQSWEDVVEIIQKNPGKEVEFDVTRDNQELEIAVTPKATVQEDGTEIGIVGVYQPVEKSPLQAFKYGFIQTYEWTKQIFVLLGDLVTGGFTIDSLSGPVGIYQSTEIVAQSGIFYLMRWAAVLSINLGIMNLLPIPALDGGRLLFIGIEAIRRKPIDKQKEGLVHFIGFALLMVLMLVVTWNDIQRLFL